MIMRLIEFEEQNAIIAENQDEYENMPAHVFDNQLVCCWKLSMRERIKILFTGKIWHFILTGKKPVQPQALTTEYPFE